MILSNFLNRQILADLPVYLKHFKELVCEKDTVFLTVCLKQRNRNARHIDDMSDSLRLIEHFLVQILQFFREQINLTDACPVKLNSNRRACTLHISCQMRNRCEIIELINAPPAIPTPSSEEPLESGPGSLGWKRRRDLLSPLPRSVPTADC